MRVMLRGVFEQCSGTVGTRWPTCRKRNAPTLVSLFCCWRLVSAEMRNYRHAADVRDGAEDDIVTQ